MTISYTSALRDQVTLTLLNRTYANCTTEEQTLLDGAISSGSLPLNAPTGGVALDTYKALAQVVQWFSEAGTGDTAIPDAFGPAYKAEMVARLAGACGPPSLARWWVRRGPNCKWPSTTTRQRTGRIPARCLA